jgi:hypothetical protein
MKIGIAIIAAFVIVWLYLFTTPVDRSNYGKQDAPAINLVVSQPVPLMTKTEMNKANVAVQAATAAREANIGPHQPNTSDEFLRVVRAERNVRESMRDPDSAKFAWSIIGRQGSICGMVNGRNAFGGMTGNQYFIIINGYIYFERTDGFASKWNKYCFD